MSEIKYASGLNFITDEPKGVVDMGMWGKRYPGQDETGYGSKITTNKMAYDPFQERKSSKTKTRFYRVYATCFSNCASFWIIKGGQKLFLASLENYFQPNRK